MRKTGNEAFHIFSDNGSKMRNNERLINFIIIDSNTSFLELDRPFSGPKIYIIHTFSTK